MAQQMVRKIPSSDLTALRESVREDFAVILEKLDRTLKTAPPQMFPSGIELIKLTFKAGSNLEFSVVVAGKDAPNGLETASLSESSFAPAKP